MSGNTDTPVLITAEEALPGRPDPVQVPERHLVLGTPLDGPWPDGARRATFAMGCFWGAEKSLWNMPGVISTFVGYAGGYTPNPTYEEVCTDMTGHAEVAVAVYDPERVSYQELITVFWENHDPTQWMRQGDDVGTRYRSAILVEDEQQKRIAEESRELYQAAISAAGYGKIVTEIVLAGPFYYAEPEHQQYLAQNPDGYCNHGFCQASFPTATGAAAKSS